MRLTPSYRTFNIMNSQDQMSIYQELERKGYLNYAETANSSDSGVYGKMYELISQYNETSGQFGLPNTVEAKAEYLRRAEYRNTDWFKELFRYSVQHNHSVSMSGGTDKGTYYASLSVPVGRTRAPSSAILPTSMSPIRSSTSFRPACGAMCLTENRMLLEP